MLLNNRCKWGFLQHLEHALIVEISSAWINLFRFQKCLTYFLRSGIMCLGCSNHQPRLMQVYFKGSQSNLYSERSHSGLVRRFAKPLRWKRLREFESLPLRHKYMQLHVLVLPNRGVAQLAEQPSPKRQVAGSIPVSPAKTPGYKSFRSFLILQELSR